MKTYLPYRKLNYESSYCHTESDPTSIKQIEKAIKTKLSQLISPNKIFDTSNCYYENSLKQCGYIVT